MPCFSCSSNAPSFRVSAISSLGNEIDSLKNDEKVQLVGFGSFETKHRAERTGRNPKTKESITIAASKVPTFKAGKAFKDAVAE